MELTNMIIPRYRKNKHYTVMNISAILLTTQTSPKLSAITSANHIRISKELCPALFTAAHVLSKKTQWH